MSRLGSVSMNKLCPWIVVAFLALPDAAAQAKTLDIDCAPAQEGAVLIDGMLGDWRGVRAVSVAGAARLIKGHKNWNNNKDASFDVLCNYSKKTLYLAFDVNDEYFSRTKGRRADDHLELRFGR